MSYYIMDSAFQGLACESTDETIEWAIQSAKRTSDRFADWIMGALSNDPWKLARFAGLYKAVQSAGGAISYGMDAVKVRSGVRSDQPEIELTRK
jgi:hypothetical protein